MENDGVLKKVRNYINDLFLSTNSINKIMTDKVNDYILIEEQPLPIRVGTKTIYVGNFTLDNSDKFWIEYGNLLAFIGVKFFNFDLLSDAKQLMHCLKVHKKFKKKLIKLIGKTILKQQGYYLDTFKERTHREWQNCSMRYFKKNMTYEKLLQICFLIYQYNFDAEKKNWAILAEKMVPEQLMETYMYFWLQNLSGLTGKFQLAQLPNLDYWQDGSLKQDIPLNRRGQPAGNIDVQKDKKDIS
jgi:hypothetical protein